MKQYIDKSALVAEIEKIIADETESIKSFEHGKNVGEVQRSNARISVLEYMRSFLDTLEVKEVNLEKEYKNFVEDDPVYSKLVNNIVGKAIAKHFFELGIKAQKGELV